jgi:hypothetical protein
MVLCIYLHGVRRTSCFIGKIDRNLTLLQPTPKSGGAERTVPGGFAAGNRGADFVKRRDYLSEQLTRLW